MSKSVKFICRRSPDDKMFVEFLNLDDIGDRELYLRMDEGDKRKGSVVLNPEQARELARRITETFGAAAPAEPKLWEEL